MSDKSNFWSSLPGIIGALLGSGGLVALIQVFGFSKPGTTTLPEPLEVYADSTKGTKYTNKEGKSVTINFSAKGKWLAIPENVSNVSDDAKGYLSPKGVPNFKPSETPCTAPLGALIVRGKDDTCIAAYGDQGNFDLEPQETVYFLMNDVIGLYEDNRGSIKVSLSISKN